MKIFIKLILIALLIGCLFKMPYGYYQIMRWLVCAGFIGLAYLEYKKEKIIIAILCGCLAILFNPLRAIYFKRYVWQQIDTWLAILLGIWIIMDLGIFFYKKRNLYLTKHTK